VHAVQRILDQLFMHNPHMVIRLPKLIATTGKQKAQWELYAKHPLAYGLMWQDFVYSLMDYQPLAGAGN